MLIDLNKREKKTLIVVTHDADIAEKADEVITIKDGEMLRDKKMHGHFYIEHNV
jgi:ABC-type lipoprotein export system ATPase subunit